MPMQAQGEVCLRAPHLPTVCGWNGCAGSSFHYRFHPISIHPFLQGFHLGAAVLRVKCNSGDKNQIRRSPRSTWCSHVPIHPTLGSASELDEFLCCHWPGFLPTDGECWGGESSGYAPSMEERQIFQKTPGMLQLSSSITFQMSISACGPEGQHWAVPGLQQSAGLVLGAGLNGFALGGQTAAADSDTELVSPCCSLCSPFSPLWKLQLWLSCVSAGQAVQGWGQ